jgi:glyoxylase-like metal-dependent hydrolase (beta-lactamase superfamily II)
MSRRSPHEDSTMIARSSVHARFRFVALAAALASLAVHAQPPAGDGLIKPEARKQVSEHVNVILDQDHAFVPNVGIVIGNKATLIVDTGLGDKNGKIVLDEARKLSRNTQFYLTATHFHPEHDLGANAFPPDAKMLRWKGQQDETDADGVNMIERFKGFSAATKSLLEGVTFRAPDVLFDEAITVDLGGVHVRIFGVGPNHTLGDTAFFVVEDKVLFTGDTVMSVLPAVSAQSASIKKWQENLSTYESLQPVVVVPAHGKLVDVSTVRRYRVYFDAVQSQTAAAKKGGASAEAAGAMLSEGIAKQFSDLAPPNGAAGRVNAAIQAAYREAP